VYIDIGYQIKQQKCERVKNVGKGKQKILAELQQNEQKIKD
jgi:hypothetical protein